MEEYQNNQEDSYDNHYNEMMRDDQGGGNIGTNDFLHNHEDTAGQEDVDITSTSILKSDEDVINSEEDEGQEQEGFQSPAGCIVGEKEIRKQRIDDTKDVTRQLERTLLRVKESTNTMLNEIGSFLQATESVTIDYLRCQSSLRQESVRLAEVAPDVAGATDRYLQMLQADS